MLDTPEYLHLAVDASRKGDHHAALNYLNQALVTEPDNACLIYFQAAEHAELGLFDRACVGMSRALDIDSGLEIARFQLGLLHLKQQRQDLAREAFGSLAIRSQDRALCHFARAWLHVLDDDPSSARSELSAGLADCSNAALKADMENLLHSLEEEIARVAVHREGEPVFLGAYLTVNEHLR